MTSRPEARDRKKCTFSKDVLRARPLTCVAALHLNGCLSGAFVSPFYR